jgi:hypothetical protein
MRYFLITIALISMILGSPLKNFSQKLNQPRVSHGKSERKTNVDVKYDKKKDTTTINLDDLILWKNPFGFEWVSLDVRFEYPKRTIVTPKSVSLIFISAARNMSAFRSGKLGAVVDGVRMDLGDLDLPRHQNLSSSKGPFMEVLGGPIPYQDFLRIAQAKKVRLEVGGNKYDLSDRQMQSLNKFLQLMQQEGVEFK